MRFVEFTWLVISLASHGGAEQSRLREKTATLNLILSGNRGAQASAQAEWISRAPLHFQDLHGPAAGYLACFSLDPGRVKGRTARTQGFRCSASFFPISCRTGTVSRIPAL